MTSGNAPRDERRPEVERRLIGAVTKLCGDGTPFAEISISRLVREAGLARATFYLYFPDRSAFVLRLIDYVHDSLARPLSALWSTALLNRQTLEAAMLEYVTIFSTEYAVIAAVVETASSDPAVGSTIDANMRTYISESAKVIEAAQAKGDICAELSAFETAAALVWMSERACYQLADTRDADAHRRLAHTLATISWNALRTN
ncbi:TetR/AcrR family transcriptional regulator [[Mycobacterium] nativiensis]|uniref:TetR/AcrR family transcriptional regulator n=1 Tax=[Mycobacterium] nativiensis TaxID=2855503 RepID=A0ABU5XV71_9MYCO|nr:TetR/AcrR family transcriptional regulator [Mycolicibacter sp. MYC340]MEB3031879.1 TetR/AcrR family transcriptional regulator [Mycolicibacter sp. MYC340]